MANPKGPPEHTKWKPGQSGNPGGKPKQILTKDKVHGVLGKFSHLTRDELQAVIQNPKSSMLEIMVAAVMAKAAKDGDASRLEFLLQRSIGKVKDEADIKINEWGKEFETAPRENILKVLRDGTNE